MRTSATLIALAVGSMAGGAAWANPGHESIGYSVTPCFGTCAVYTAAVTPAGHVTFDGHQHVSARGKHHREGGHIAFRRTIRALAPYRPRLGTTAATRCKQQVGDHHGYRLVWTERDGTQTVLTHDRGCISPVNRGLNVVMDALPRILGISPWIAAPHTPPSQVRSSSVAPRSRKRRAPPLTGTAEVRVLGPCPSSSQAAASSSWSAAASPPTRPST